MIDLMKRGLAAALFLAPAAGSAFSGGDDDGRTLYVCARSGLYRIRLNIPGVRPTPN